MASRYTVTKPIVRCEAPVRVFRNGEYIYFPCGRCPACLLDKSNAWSRRLVDEIENTPFSIFFTLTYSNKYLPKLYRCDDRDISPFPFYYSNHFDNIRFNGVNDVRREDNIFIETNRYYYYPISCFDRQDCISYCSKRDIILWLKLIRKDIDEEFNLKNLSDEEKKPFRFRYFIISEYGPTTYRAHLHGFVFAYHPQVAEYLLRLSLFKNWSMCDCSLFQQYTHYCSGGAAGYVTNYLNCSNCLPQVFKNKQIRPFRLCSKNPSIGYSSFNPEEILQNVSQGVNTYNKVVQRCEIEYVFPYPQDFAHRLFPKCREYSLLSDKRLHYIYGFLWRSVVVRKLPYDVCNRFIHSCWFPADITATQKCYQYCLMMNWRPETYLYTLDLYYRMEAAFALKRFYEWQEKNADKPVSIMFSYVNFQNRVLEFNQSSIVEKNTLLLFCSSFNVDVYDIVDNGLNSLAYFDSEKEIFNLEVQDILANSVKMPKFNEKFGFAPHII